jgi:hypothetical protein
LLGENISISKKRERRIRGMIERGLIQMEYLGGSCPTSGYGWDANDKITHSDEGGD